jgi:hypothetical protein
MIIGVDIGARSYGWHLLYHPNFCSCGWQFYFRPSSAEAAAPVLAMALFLQTMLLIFLLFLRKL